MDEENCISVPGKFSLLYWNAVPGTSGRLRFGKDIWARGQNTVWKALRTLSQYERKVEEDGTAFERTLSEGAIDDGKTCDR